MQRILTHSTMLCIILSSRNQRRITVLGLHVVDSTVTNTTRHAREIADNDDERLTLSVPHGSAFYLAAEAWRAVLTQ